MQKITPFLWFEKNMKEIVDFYKSVFPGTTVKGNGELENTPSGTVQMATLEIFGLNFDLMTAGPYLPFRPTISFIVACESADEVDQFWSKLSETGKVLMALDSYPFAEKYGWVQDQYGVSWQIMFSTQNRPDQRIVPTMMFAGDTCGRAEEAINFYTSVFQNSKVFYSMPYTGNEPVDDPRAKIMHASISLENFTIALMDSGKQSPLSFNQAVSFVVSCEDQKEIDYFWEKLTEGGKEVQCGWLSDKFGMPWQIVPADMDRMMSTGTKEQIGRATAAFMKMVKFDIAELERAFEGE